MTDKNEPLERHALEDLAASVVFTMVINSVERIDTASAVLELNDALNERAKQYGRLKGLTDDDLLEVGRYVDDAKAHLELDFSGVSE